MRLLLLLAGLLPLTAWAADGGGYVRIPAGDFTTTLAYQDARGPVRIAPFEIMRHPVTNAEFLEIETLGPITKIEPGKTLEHVERWTLHKNVKVAAWTDAELDRVVAPLVAK